MTPWLGRAGSGEAPTTAIVLASRRICSGLLTILKRASGGARGALAVDARGAVSVRDRRPRVEGGAVRTGRPPSSRSWLPHREAVQEADALERWDGDGAVRLLDARRRALRAAARALRAGHVPLRVRRDARRRARSTCCRGSGRAPTASTRSRTRSATGSRTSSGARPGSRTPRSRYLRELAPTQGEQVLVNQDLHGDNVLAAQREPWLVIDPKPLAARARVRGRADRPLGRARALASATSLYRLDRLCAELGLDRERAIGWTVAQTVAWSGARLHRVARRGRAMAAGG